MIIWLASYPKSGNTLLRSILATYLFSNDGNLKLDYIYKIRQFPSIDDFQKLNIDLSNEKEVFQAQRGEEINQCGKELMARRSFKFTVGRK